MNRQPVTDVLQVQHKHLAKEFLTEFMNRVKMQEFVFENVLFDYTEIRLVLKSTTCVSCFKSNDWSCIGYILFVISQGCEKPVVNLVR